MFLSPDVNRCRAVYSSLLLSSVEIETCHQQLSYFFYLYTFQVIVYIYDAIEFTSKFSLIILIKLHYNSYYIFGLPFHGAGNIRVSFIQHIYLHSFHVLRLNFKYYILCPLTNSNCISILHFIQATFLRHTRH